MDHRLIAAGHPALRFEFASYQTEPVYTKHWREKGYGPDVEAWAWAIGQVGAARSAANLLAHRADASGRDWPELAEYACFSCHQRLPADPRPVRRDAPPPGSLPWGSWHFPLTLELAGPGAAAWTAPPTPASDLHKLAALFRASDRPAPGTANTKDADLPVTSDTSAPSIPGATSSPAIARGNEPARTVQEPSPTHEGHFEFGSYGRVYAASDLRGSTGRGSNVVGAKEFRTTLRMSSRLRSSPAPIACTRILPIAVASPGPAMTGRLVQSATN